MRSKKFVNNLNQLQQSQTLLPTRVCLLGFMGAGKTATAQSLAQSIGADWIDLDEFIEARENRRIWQIIENLGEKVFREIETEALREVLKIPENKILALGGGTWTISENRRIIEAAESMTIWLDASFELCWRRISAVPQIRPLALGKTRTRTLFSARRKIYQTATAKVKISEKKTLDDITLEIIRLILPPQSNRSKPIDKTAPSR